jgi:hypothetical protein
MTVVNKAVDKNKIALEQSIVSGQHLTLGIVKGMWNESYFLDFYLGECQKNGVQSYRRVFPQAKYMSAKASASRMLRKPSVVQAMKYKSEKMEVTEKY